MEATRRENYFHRVTRAAIRAVKLEAAYGKLLESPLRDFAQRSEKIHAAWDKVVAARRALKVAVNEPKTLDEIEAEVDSHFAS